MFTLRRGTAVGVSALALLAPMGATAVAAAPTVSASFGAIDHHVTVGGPLHVGPGTISNWGGYVAIRTAGTFTKASASWKVAKVTCNGSGLFAPWVGIDGDGSSTVEQTGVQTECNGTTPEYSAWYEMYPQSPVYYPDPISLGDKFNASVTANGTQFTLKITDVTKGWTESVTQTLASAQRLSAEAVIEAPGGYPDFQVQKFMNVKFNGKSLKSWNPTEYDTQSGSSTVYTATPIRHKTNFKMVPKS